MSSFDITLYCNANGKVGFGHLRRCIQIAALLLKERGTRIALAGDLSDEARETAQLFLPGVPLLDSITGTFSDVGVMDCMFDPEDPEYYDQDLIREFSATCSSSALLTSSLTAPGQLPVSMVIGHLVQPPENINYRVMAGLRFSPVAADVEEYRRGIPAAKEEINRVFLGFGSWHKPDALLITLDALKMTKFRGGIDLLLPPVLKPKKDIIEQASRGLEVEFHHNVPSVSAILSQADIAIGSYGHLTFESMALGVPFVSVAVKACQMPYNDHLDKKGLILSAGWVDNLDARNISKLVSKLDHHQRQALAARSYEAVDGRGIRRIADLLWKETKASLRGAP